MGAGLDKCLRRNEYYDPPRSLAPTKSFKPSHLMASSHGVFLETNQKARADAAAAAAAAGATTTTATADAAAAGAGAAGAHKHAAAVTVQPVGPLRDTKDARSGTAATNDLDELARKMTGMCVECEDQPSEVACEACDEDFCEVCFVAQHKRGTRAAHKMRRLPKNTQLHVPPPKVVAPEVLAAEAKAKSASAAVAQKMAAVANARLDLDAPDTHTGYWFEERARWIPIRLTDAERRYLRLVEATLNVSEYTDKIDIYSYEHKTSRIVRELKECLSVISGLTVASDYKQGNAVIKGKSFGQNAGLFQAAFEVARRHKIRNPEKMRSAYGQLMCVLQDSTREEVAGHMGFGLVRPVVTVQAFLEYHNALHVLHDARLEAATKEVVSDGKTRAEIDAQVKDKEDALEFIARKYCREPDKRAATSKDWAALLKKFEGKDPAAAAAAAAAAATPAAAAATTTAATNGAAAATASASTASGGAPAVDAKLDGKEAAAASAASGSGSSGAAPARGGEAMEDGEVRGDVLKGSAFDGGDASGRRPASDDDSDDDSDNDSIFDTPWEKQRKLARRAAKRDLAAQRRLASNEAAAPAKVDDRKSRRSDAPSTLSYDDIKMIVASISDHHSYLRSNRDPIDYMMKFLTTYWKPDVEDEEFGLAISSGYGGACFSHSHKQQYMFVYQSLLLWRHIMHDMYKLWMLCEADLLDKDNFYRLRDTGQGLNRMQSAPRVGRAMSQILSTVQAKVGYAGYQSGWGGGWMGSSVVHLGDVDVPNGLVFIDKYNQVSRILAPIVNVVRTLPHLCATRTDVNAYVTDTFGGPERAIKIILCDYFRHGFDGSGSDGGSCIDGRLTSNWNWCSLLSKKPYHSIFLMCGFVGFDGDFA